MEDLDRILKNSLDRVKFPKEWHTTVEEIEKKDKERKNKFYRIKNIAVVILIVCVCILGSIMKNSFESQEKDSNITAKVESESQEEYIIYSSNEPNANDSRIDLSTQELFEYCKYIAIVKITNTYATNYDIKYDRHYNGEIGYTFVRTISSAKVIKIIKGDYDEEEIVFRKKGGKILYSQYLKYFEVYPLIAKDKEVEQQYENMIKEGIKEENIFVDISVGYQNYNLDVGKEYIVFMTKKANGMFWAEGSENSIMEYNESTGKVYDKSTQKWIDLNEIID